MQQKSRMRVVGALMVAAMALGSAPAAYADVSGVVDEDIAHAVGGHGGNGGAAVGVGVCLINVSLFGDAGCRNNGVADASGGDGGDAEAIADLN
jgi:hypothetical protein